MSAPGTRPWIERVTLRLVRWLLWPVARLRPHGGMARIYHRLCDLERSGSLQAPRRVTVRPELVLVLLLTGALLAWLHDVLRRPAPEPDPPASAATATRRSRR
jgi:hypothetical protein